MFTALKNGHLQIAVAATVSQHHSPDQWDDSVLDHELAQALTRSPPSFDSNRFDLDHSEIQSPQTQIFRNGSLESALRLLRIAGELRQWAEEYHVVECPRVLRDLVN